MATLALRPILTCLLDNEGDPELDTESSHLQKQDQILMAPVVINKRNTVTHHDS